MLAGNSVQVSRSSSLRHHVKDLPPATTTKPPETSRLPGAFLVAGVKSQAGLSKGSSPEPEPGFDRVAPPGPEVPSDLIGAERALQRSHVGGGVFVVSDLQFFRGRTLDGRRPREVARVIIVGPILTQAVASNS